MPISSSVLDYRKDIDGLRAVAVIAVVLNHAEFSLFRGGYVGVDVFFVISGYLISRVVMSEVVNAQWSFRQFCLRRIRRLVPALYVVLLICIPISYLLMLPSELVDFANTVVGATLFVSNIILYRQGGYFDVDADLKPLLHLWSLSVEEQFYLLFPLILVPLVKLRRRVLLASVLSLAILSFSFMVMNHREAPRATFFLLPTRVWEILSGVVLGAIIVLFPRARQNLLVEKPLAVLGLTLIAFAVFWFNSAFPYPGPLTSIPIVGAALVIWFGGRGHAVDLIMSWRPLQAIGLASYSIYLVHQPILVFWRLASGEFLSLSERILAVATIFFSGLVLHKTVEEPLRNKSRAGTKMLVLSVVAVSTVLIAASILTIQSNGFSDRLPANFPSSGQRPDGPCTDHDRDFTEIQGFLICDFGDVGSSEVVVLLGDSHADALLNAMNDILTKNKTKGIRVFSGCPVVPGGFQRGIDQKYIAECNEVFSNLLKFVRRNGASVVVSARWTFRLYPIPGWIDTLSASNSEGGYELESDYREYVIADSNGEAIDYASKSQAVANLLDGLAASADQVVVVGPVPELAWNVLRMNFAHYRSRGELRAEISIPHLDHKRRNRFIDQVLSDYVTDGPPNVTIVNPEKVFCDTFMPSRCVGQWNSIPFYWDDDHLSDVGAQMLLERITAFLE